MFRVFGALFDAEAPLTTDAFPCFKFREEFMAGGDL